MKTLNFRSELSNNFNNEIIESLNGILKYEIENIEEYLKDGYFDHLKLDRNEVNEVLSYFSNGKFIEVENEDMKEFLSELFHIEDGLDGFNREVKKMYKQFSKLFKQFYK